MCMKCPHCGWSWEPDEWEDEDPIKKLAIILGKEEEIPITITTAG